MKLKQRLTPLGKWGVFLFFAGPIVALGTREWLISYLKSLRGTGITQMPDVTLYHAAILGGALMFLISIPMLIIGREYQNHESPTDNVLWR